MSPDVKFHGGESAYDAPSPFTSFLRCIYYRRIDPLWSRWVAFRPRRVSQITAPKKAAPTGSWNYSLLALCAVFGVIMLPRVIHDSQVLATTAPSIQTDLYLHESLIYYLILSGSLLAATHRPGWKILGVVCGAALLYMGVAALFVPSNPGSYGILGGLLCLVGGGLYLTAVAWGSRQDKPRLAVEKA